MRYPLDSCLLWPPDVDGDVDNAVTHAWKTPQNPPHNSHCPTEATDCGPLTDETLKASLQSPYNKRSFKWPQATHPSRYGWIPLFRRTEHGKDGWPLIHRVPGRLQPERLGRSHAEATTTRGSPASGDAPSSRLRHPEASPLPGWRRGWARLGGDSRPARLHVALPSSPRGSLRRGPCGIELTRCLRFPPVDVLGRLRSIPTHRSLSPRQRPGPCFWKLRGLPMLLARQ